MPIPRWVPIVERLTLIVLILGGLLAVVLWLVGY